MHYYNLSLPRTTLQERAALQECYGPLLPPLPLLTTAEEAFQWAILHLNAHFPGQECVAVLPLRKERPAFKDGEVDYHSHFVWEEEGRWKLCLIATGD